jgi:heat shock protein HslJ
MVVSFSYAEEDASKPKGADQDVNSESKAPSQSFVGDWIVKELADAKIPEEVKTPTLTIKKDGSVAGFGGVNRFFGKFVDERGKLFGPMGSTRMAGSPEAMKVESAFFRALEKATTSKQTDKHLQLLDAQGKILVAFDMTSTNADITGEWILKNLSGNAIPTEVKTPTLAIKEDGSLAGFGGVNRFFGKAAADNKKLFGPIGSTMMAGSPEAMKVESQLFQALDKTTQAKTADGKLVLLDAEDNILAEFAAAK